MTFLLPRNTYSLCSLFILLLLTPFFANGNQKKPAWGKLSKEEIALKTVPYEQEAHAVVLFNIGELSYFNNNFKIQKHFRIKVLDNEGLSQGDIVIPYYAKDGTESITRIKAQTIGNWKIYLLLKRNLLPITWAIMQKKFNFNSVAIKSAI